MRFSITLLVTCLAKTCSAQLTFFNMPNPDMFPQVGYGYAEYDRYQSVRGNENVNADVTRIAYQLTPFVEVGTNLWFNKELPKNPDKIVLSTKWRVWLFQGEKIKLSLSPGSWTSFYFDKNISLKNIGYTFLGLTFNHSEKIYTRLMLGGYGKYWKFNEKLGQKVLTGGVIAGIEQRLTKRLVLVSDYFQGSGEGFGLAAGFVYYAAENGKNLPLYFAFQRDNDSRKNDLIIAQIGYFFRAIRRSAKKSFDFSRASQKIRAQRSSNKL
jgi:hypothetical protein